MKKIIIFCFLIFLIVGCTSTTPILTLTVNTPTHFPTTASPTATLEPSQDVCKKVEQVDKSKIESQGDMIFTNMSYREYKIDATTFVKSDLVEEGRFPYSIAVSPNRELIALQFYFQKTEPEYLRVKSQDGLVDIVIPWEEEWSSITSWLDNERLLINTYIEVEDGDIQAEEFSTFLVFNPFTGESELLIPDFPNIYSHHMFPAWSRFGSIIYNPTLDRILYLRADSFDADWYYVLWDLKKKQKIVDFPVFIEPNAIPVWSLDGNKFAMAPSLFISDNSGENWPAYNLYVVDLDGKTEKITNLIEYFRWFYIGRLSWSPDNKYIAFWFSGWNENPDSFTLIADQYLGVVEVETKNLRIFCISGSTYPSGVVPSPVWSPDGTQIIVESPLSEEHSQVLLLDLEKEVIAKIGEDMIPVGWMVEP